MPLGDGTLFANSSDTPKEHRQHCTWCCDEGILPGGTIRTASSYKGVKREADQEIWFPCPMCELGYKRGATDAWRGQDTTQLVKQCRCDERAVPRQEGLAAMEEAKRSMAHMLDPPDPDADRQRTEPEHHRCPNFGGKDMPWRRTQCEFCGVQTEELTL